MNAGTLILLASVVVYADPATESKPIKVQSVLLRLIEQADVSAKEAGVLAKMNVREGNSVSEDEQLARIEDVDALLTKRRAELDLDIARRQAANDVNIRFARKSADVAKAELDRALKSKRQIPDSVSQSEIDSLRLTYEQAILQTEQAQFDTQVAKLTQTVKENDVAFANSSLDRHKIKAPLSGVVVKIYRRKGEWVEPGEKVMRIIRIDRLRAEGFVDAKSIRGNLVDHHVTLQIGLADDPKAEFIGKVVFVSPEIDPVNGQVRVWAEIENRDLLLRPGLRASMQIDPRKKVEESQASKSTEKKTKKTAASNRKKTNKRN